MPWIFYCLSSSSNANSSAADRLRGSMGQSNVGLCSSSLVLQPWIFPFLGESVHEDTIIDKILFRDNHAKTLQEPVHLYRVMVGVTPGFGRTNKSPVSTRFPYSIFVPVSGWWVRKLQDADNNCIRTVFLFLMEDNEAGENNGACVEGGRGNRA